MGYTTDTIDEALALIVAEHGSLDAAVEAIIDGRDGEPLSAAVVLILSEIVERETTLRKTIALYPREPGKRWAQVEEAEEALRALGREP